MKKQLAFAFFALTLTACSQVPKEAYFNRGTPESLLDVSSEVVNISLASDQSIDDLSNWVNQDQPTRAELLCLDSDPLCNNAQQVLDQFGVPVQYVSAGDNTVSLYYDRVVARDCENRYIDNHINPYHMNHPVFGCSVAANMVQQVGDKQQFVSPSLMDYPDAEKAVQTYGLYLKPPPDVQPKDSLLDEVRSEGSQ